MLFTELHELPDGFAWDFQLRNNQVRGDDDVARSLNHLRCDVIIGRLGADQEVFTGVSFDQVQRCPSVGMRHFDEVIEVNPLPGKLSFGHFPKPVSATGTNK